MDPPTAYIFPETYDRIVIVKGPQTVLRGPGNAAATVMFERDAPRYDEFDLRARGSMLTATADRRDVVADLAAGNENVYGQLTASRAESGDIVVPSNLRDCSIQLLSWPRKRSLVFADTASLSLLM